MRSDESCELAKQLSEDRAMPDEGNSESASKMADDQLWLCIARKLGLCRPQNASQGVRRVL